MRRGPERGDPWLASAIEDEALRAELEAIVGEYPQRRGGAMMCLHRVQQHRGAVSDPLGPEAPGSHQALQYDADPVRAVGDVSWEPQKYKERYGDQRAASCEHVDHAGDETGAGQESEVESVQGGIPR